MRSLLPHPYRHQEAPELLPAGPLAERPRAAAAPPLPPKRAHADEVLRELRAADRALGMRVQVAPQPRAARPMPGIATIAYLSAVSVAIRVDQAVHADTLHVIDEIRALLDGRPELLAPFADELEQAVAKQAAPMPDSCVACGREFAADAKRWSIGKDMPMFVHVICPSDGSAFAPFADAVKAQVA